MINKLTVKHARAFAIIARSGYADRYPMPEGLTIFADLGGADLRISAIGWDDAAEQLTTIAGAVGDETPFSEYRRAIADNFTLLLRYRDGGKSSTVRTTNGRIRSALTAYTKQPLKFTDEGRNRTLKECGNLTREELLGIKQQMDAIKHLD